MIRSTLLRIQLGQKDLDWICTSDCKLASWIQLSFPALQSSPHDNTGIFQAPEFQVKLAVITLEYPQYITCTGSILKALSYIKISHPYFTDSDVTLAAWRSYLPMEKSWILSPLSRNLDREPHSGQFIDEEVLVTLAQVAQRGGSPIPRNIPSLDEALSDLIQLKMSLLMARGWTRRPLDVPPNPFCDSKLNGSSQELLQHSSLPLITPHIPVELWEFL